MRRIQFIAVFLIAIAPINAAPASVECVRTQCEGKGRTCVEALYVTYGACVTAARKTCDTVPTSEKFKCLTEGLRPCALTRNKEQAACLTDVHACYKACGPFKGKRNDYWCVASFGKGATAAFCAADPGASSPLDQCAKAFNRPEALQAGLTCEPLY